MEDTEDHDLIVFDINVIDDDVRELHDRELARSGSASAPAEARQPLQLSYGLNDP